MLEKCSILWPDLCSDIRYVIDCWKWHKCNGKGELLGIFYGLFTAAFYAALMLLIKFIQNMANLL
ncbi:hypothetical protein WQ54_12600 [Bacillus sp. SA1-12]|nr:hypothetical protein WQ54_12600 [Bacillus sp. SA1-12]